MSFWFSTAGGVKNNDAPPENEAQPGGPRADSNTANSSEQAGGQSGTATRKETENPTVRGGTAGTGGSGPADETAEEADSAGAEACDQVKATDVIDILSNQRRRLLWRYLQEEPPRAELSDASRRIAAWENDTTVDDVDYSERKSVYTSPHQFHCPKMQEAGLLEFKKRESAVRVASTEPEAFVVEVDPDVSGVLTTALASLAVATGLIVGAWALGLPVFGDLTLPAVLLATGIGAVPALSVYSHLVRADYDISLLDALARIDAESSE